MRLLNMLQMLLDVLHQAAGMQVHARAHLPSLEDKQGIHVDMIDTFGTRHRFRYCSWINNSSRMYLLEGVAPALVCSFFTLPSVSIVV